MMGSMLPPELGEVMRDPAMRAMMEQVMRGLLQGGAGEGGAGGGGAGDLPGGLGGLLGGAAGGGSPEDALRMMRELEQMMGSLPDGSEP
jgi:hypothetical protein